MPRNLPGEPESNGMQSASGSIRKQLILWNIAALLVFMAVLGVTCRVVSMKVMVASVDAELLHSTRMFTHPPQFKPHEDGGHKPAPASPDADSVYREIFVTEEGRSASDTDKRAPWDANALLRALRGETVFSFAGSSSDPVRVITRPGFTPFGGHGAVQRAYPLKDVYRAVGSITTTLTLLAPLTILGAIWMGITLTRRVLCRVHTLTVSARSCHGFSDRLPSHGNDEFSELASAFNGMLSQLDDAYSTQKSVLERQKQFTADASHELKTPLTVIRGVAGIGAAREANDERTRRAFEDIETAAQSMSGLVQDLLLLARSDEGHVAEDVTELLLVEVVTSACQLSGEPERVVVKAEDPDMIVMGSHADYDRLFRNIIENGLNYSRNTQLPVVVTLKKCGDMAVITVQDRGIGIAAEHIPHLGERFYRVDSSRTRPTGGTGLGLSICKSILAAHGGDVEFASVTGEGTSVTIRLPLAAGQTPEEDRPMQLLAIAPVVVGVGG